MSSQNEINKIIGEAYPTSRFIFNAIQDDQEKEEVFKFMQNEFRISEPITQAIGCTEEDTYDFYQDICSDALVKPYSIIARFKKDKRLAGICLNKLLNPYNKCEKLNSEKKFEYSTEIKNGIYKNMNANRLFTIVETAEQNPMEFIPDCKNPFKIEILCVHRDFTGCGLGTMLVNLSVKIAENLNCDYILTCASAKTSNHIFNKIGFKTLRRINFNEFLENGVQVYQNLHDSGDGISFMSIKL